jgi:hypothetical protein
MTSASNEAAKDLRLTSYLRASSLADGREILSAFLAKWDGDPEFADICAAIRHYLEGDLA